MRTELVTTDEVALRAFLSEHHNLRATSWSSWAADDNVTLVWTEDHPSAKPDSPVALLAAPVDHPVWAAGVL